MRVVGPVRVAGPVVVAGGREEVPAFCVMTVDERQRRNGATRSAAGLRVGSSVWGSSAAIVHDLRADVRSSRQGDPGREGRVRCDDAAASRRVFCFSRRHRTIEVVFSVLMLLIVMVHGAVFPAYARCDAQTSAGLWEDDEPLGLGTASGDVFGTSCTAAGGLDLDMMRSGGSGAAAEALSVGAAGSGGSVRS